MSLKIYHQLICRTPVFHTDTELALVWDEIKELIREASPDLYREIKMTDSRSINSLSENILSKIWKYFNRAKFRSTPFGGFAAISMVTVNDHESACHLIITNMSRSTIMNDWQEAGGVALPPLSFDSFIQCNPTCYFANNNSEVRYLRVVADGNELASIDNSELIITVIRHTRSSIIVNELLKLLSLKFSYTTEVLTDALNQLNISGLIYTDRIPNITGPDYFERIQIPLTNTTTKYRIDQKELRNGSLPKKYLRNIKGYFQFMNDLSKTRPSTDLAVFIKRFQDKFGEQFLPLGIVMDPELGISYAGMGERLRLLNDTVFSSLNDQEESKENTFGDPFISFLIDAIAERRPISLDGYQIKHKASNIMPNTFSAVISFNGKQPVIESAGGCTANALLGRFTMAGKPFEELARSMSEIEKKANPDVIFFDIAYVNEHEVDNVNRRCELYDHQLCLFTWSVSTQSLQLADIYVNVQNGRVVLWSNSLKKRLIPRLASAYNYKRSNVALFRFLCDLQYQDLLGNLTLDLKELIPGCKFYPQIYFRDLIVSPAAWLVPRSFKGIQKNDIVSTIPLFRSWLMKNIVSRYFKAGSGDRTLFFDTTKESDLLMFLSSLVSVSSAPLYIVEAALSDLVSDEFGNNYNSQFLLSFYHQECVYRPIPAGLVELFDAELNNFNRIGHIPGSEWLYFEIYCHPIRSNEILGDLIFPALTASEVPIEKWFFIRYNTPSYHLRLRAKFRSKVHAARFMLFFTTKLSQCPLSGLVADIQVKTYYPEMHRYRLVGIEAAESLFFLDSLCIKSLLERGLAMSDLYQHAFSLMLDVFSCLVITESEKLKLITRLADAFKDETGWTRSELKTINFNYRSFAASITGEHSIYRSVQNTEILVRLRNIAKSGKETNLIETFVADIIHLHINRLFIDDQRIHEAVLYQYLTRHLMKLQALKALPPVS